MLQQPTPVAPAALFHVESSHLWVELVEELTSGLPEVLYTGFAPSLKEARDRYQSLSPDLLLLDLRLSDGDALGWAEELRRRRFRTKIILCTSRIDDVVLYNFDRLKIEGLLWKECTLAPKLQQAIATILAGGRYFPAELVEARRRLRSDPNAWFKLLSDREQELLPLMGRGLTDVDIAIDMALSSETVHSHRQSIMRKLGLHRTIDLIQWAHRTGFTPLMPSSRHSHLNR